MRVFIVIRFSHKMVNGATLDKRVHRAHNDAAMEDVWIPLLIRMVVTASVVISATAIAERAGPFYGALIGAFPTSAGPAYIMLALKENDAFVAASAVGSMASMIAIAPFVTVLVWLAPRTNVFFTVGAATLVWVIFAVPITMVEWTPWTALAANAVMYPLCFWLTHNHGQDPGPQQVRTPARWYELPLRALIVGLVVAAVVTGSSALGPMMTGLGAVFPIVFLGLTAVLHIRLGGAAAAATMRSALRVVSGMVFALMMVHYGVLWWGAAIGLSMSLLVSILWAMGMLALNWRMTRRVV